MATSGNVYLCTGLLVLFVASSLINSATASTKTRGKPWPMPHMYTSKPDTLQLSDKTFKFSAGITCDILDDAFRRYFRYIFYAGKERGTSGHLLKFKPNSQNAREATLFLKGLEVRIERPCEGVYPSLEMDESYSLRLPSETGTLLTKTVWGALRGLETFSQLVYEDRDDVFLVNVTEIDDKPRFAWRGVLLDTSRHFLAKEAIFQNLEAMSFNKMNVFHWHIVDDHSFPYQSRNFPKLSDKGSYNPYTHVYTQADVKDVIEFARRRGIRVVPEFDSPGHTQSWGKGQPGFLTTCYDGVTPNGVFGPVDPTLNTTWSFLKGFMKELSEVFPDNYLHIGGDEVSFSCWQSNPAIHTFMQAHSLGKDYSKLEDYYMQNLLEIVSSYNKEYLVWQEVFDNGVNVRPDTVVHVWKGGYQSELYNVTKLGLRTVLSSPWYLDYISYGHDWSKYYVVEPLNFNGSSLQNAMVMGGEACLWGEYVDNTNVESRLWPRASAIAERLWSPAEIRDATAAAPRMEEHRCRMIRRGILAEPPSGPGFYEYEAPVYTNYLSRKWAEL